VLLPCYATPEGLLTCVWNNVKLLSLATLLLWYAAPLLCSLAMLLLRDPQITRPQHLRDIIAAGNDFQSCQCVRRLLCFVCKCCRYEGRRSGRRMRGKRDDAFMRNILNYGFRNSAMHVRRPCEVVQCIQTKGCAWAHKYSLQEGQ
jgi:hypothetical protein